MPELLLAKINDEGHFAPVGGDIEAIEKLVNGEVIKVKWTLARNPRFHRKMFALFRFAFDAMPEPSPVMHNGVEVQPQKDFDMSRKFLTVQAGFYDVVGLPDGSVRLQAKSLRYAAMDQEEFRRVYSAVIDVVLSFLPYRMTGQELDKAVENLMRFT